MTPCQPETITGSPEPLCLDSLLADSFDHSESLLPSLESFLNSPFAEFERFQMLGNHLDGGCSRVFSFHPEVAPNKVLKLTSCPATRELLGRLNEMDKWNRPAALPRVERCLGVCAVDADGIEYTGYVMERLRRPRTLYELTLVQDAVQWVREAMQRASVDLKVYHHWSTSLAALDLLMRNDLYFLSRALKFIREVIVSRKAFLDLEMPGNILFGQDGRMVLADPVAMSCSLSPP